MRITLYTGVDQFALSDHLRRQGIAHTAIETVGWTAAFGQEFGSEVVIAFPDHASDPEDDRARLFGTIRGIMDEFQQKTVMVVNSNGQTAMAYNGVPERWRVQVAEWEREYGESYLTPRDHGVFLESYDGPVCTGCGLPHPNPPASAGSRDPLAALMALSALGKAGKTAPFNPPKTIGFHPLGDFPDFPEDPGKKGGRRDDN